MASILKRGNLQWQVTIRKRGHPTTCKTFETKAEAEAWAKEIETDMNKSRFVSFKEAERWTLAECLERFKEDYLKINLKDPRRELTRADRIAQRKIALKIMAMIRSKDIADFRREREKEGAAPDTIRLEFALISKLFNVARMDWGMESLTNPIKLASKPKLPDGRDRRLEEGEEERLLGACSPDFRPIVLFALETAMRRGEIVALEWKHIDFKRYTAYLAAPKVKNGEARTVPLSPAAIDVLQAIPRNISGRVFPFCADHLSSKMAKACRAAGLEDLRFHDLRHEATSRLFEDTDLDTMEIKSITGHKTLQMLTRYSHLRAHKLAHRLRGGQRGEVVS